MKYNIKNLGSKSKKKTAKRLNSPFKYKIGEGRKGICLSVN